MGFGVDLIDGPAADHLCGEVVQTAIDVSGHPAWAQIIGRPVMARVMWNDFGTGRPPCPEALALATSAGSAWIITAGWERQQSKLTIQLGTDNLMVIFSEKFLHALGYHDPARGRAEPGTAPTCNTPDSPFSSQESTHAIPPICSRSGMWCRSVSLAHIWMIGEVGATWICR